MHLRELRVNGFKSFADPTKLVFDHGVIAIVGPNGCGKSNIADAIRWVLGEQSAKALRGGKMQDVIFEGTDQRKPVQLCEVALVFTNCESLLGEGYHEVEITRRVSRDGQSDYFLNGKACRLKDIQRIFMDTGIGRSSYSIMAQGQIDQILSSNPVERRAIFEEAAGITKYKSQRREALNKLKLVEGNLARLNDVLDEVKRQINSLRRQASKALRYKKIRYRLEKLDLAHNGYQYSRLHDELAALEEKVSGLDAEVARESAAVESDEAAIEERKTERSRLNAKLQEVQQAVFDLRSRKEQADNAAQLAEARREDNAGRLEEAKKEISRMEGDLEEASKEAAGNARSKEEQRDVVAGSDRLFKERDDAVRKVQARLSEEEKQLAEEKSNLMRAENDVSRLRAKNSELELNLKSDEVRASGLDEEIASLKQEETEADENLARLAQGMTDADEAHANAQRELEAARARVGEGREAFRAKQAEIQTVDRTLAQNNARLRLLQQLQEKLEGFSEGAKALLNGKLDDVLPEGTEYYAVTRDIQVKSGYAQALETLLGSAIDSVAVTDPDAALAAVTALDQQKRGKACLAFAIDEPPADSDPSDLPSFLVPATELFTTNGDSARHPLRSLLGRSYYAESAAEFFEFWKSQPRFDFRHVVTAKGELIDRRGLVFGGFGKGKENSILQREAEIQKLGVEIEAEQKKHASLKEEAETLQAKLEEAEKGVETAHESVRDAAGKRSSLEAEYQSAERARKESISRRERLEADRKKLQERRTAAQEEFDSLKKNLSDAEKVYAERKEAITACENRIQETRKELEAEREKLSEVRFDLAQKKQRLEMLDRGLSEMESKSEELRQGIARRREEIERLGEQITSLEKEKTDQKKRAAELETELKQAQARVEEVRREYSGVEEAISSSEKTLHDSRVQLDRKRSELNQLQVKQAEKRSRREYLLEEIQREYEVSLPEVDWRECLWRADEEPAGPHPLELDDDEEEGGSKKKKKQKEARPPMTDEDRAAMDETDWEAVKKEIESARSRIHSMGPVNLVAIEEYAELKERHEFLNTQHTDLVQSRDELLKAIDDINHRSTTQFKEIFEQIKKNFAYTFENLFAGGKATLELLESEDPLEAGIDIVAQPPGTKLKGIVLLSGGQKTMTAVALLFAIYMVKPSPFCVLDELDAPLDEANIGRFTGMLKEFTRESQFVIITHNKRTISEAQAIFGVTMEEKGVSKVVSMRFNADKQRAEPEKAAAPAYA